MLLNVKCKVYNVFDLLFTYDIPETIIKYCIIILDLILFLISGFIIGV